MSHASPKPRPVSLGHLFLSRSMHERMQIERYQICQFLRQEALPLFRRGMTVLDAGSGHLEEQVMRAELLATGITLHTMDMNPGHGVTFTGDVSAMEFATASYDAVICTQVMEHVQSPGKTCAELARVVKPGGYVFITAPQSAPLHNVPWHFFNPTKFGLQMLAENNGLEVRKVVPLGGHFSQLATSLLYTVPVLQQSSLPGIIKAPATLLARFFFGFVAKLILIPLDKYDTEKLNAAGWCFATVKRA